MPEQIAMTPPGLDGYQVFWEKEDTEYGALYLPTDSTGLELLEVGAGELIIEDLDVIGRGGSDKAYPATVYRTPRGNALRVISNNDSIGQGGIEWLNANLCLWASLIVASKLDLFHQSMVDHFFKGGVVTPSYLGFLASDRLGSAYLLTDVSDRRSIIGVNDERYSDTFAAYSFAKASIDKMYGEDWVILDPSLGNCLLGKDDIVILDAIPGPKLLDT